MTLKFMNLSRGKRISFIDTIADDVEGMIERLRTMPATTESVSQRSRLGRAVKEFDASAHNFENVDFIKTAEVVVAPEVSESERNVFAQVEFLSRLYIQGKRGRIDFGVQRAFLVLGNIGAGRLSKVQDFERGKDRRAYYVTLHDAPEKISICMDAPPGATIAELALPPGLKENYFAKIAVATPEVTIDALSAELVVSLNAEGLYLSSSKEKPLTARTQAKIKAIMDIVAARNAIRDDQKIDGNGSLRRKLTVKKRS